MKQIPDEEILTAYAVVAEIRSNPPPKASVVRPNTGGGGDIISGADEAQFVVAEFMEVHLEPEDSIQLAGSDGRGKYRVEKLAWSVEIKPIRILAGLTVRPNSEAPGVAAPDASITPKPWS